MSKLRTVSWILLTLLGVATLLGSLASVGVAYFSEDDQIGPITLSELTAGRDDVAVAIKARRATAAAFGVGYSALFLMVVLGPYRRGDVWSWWALLIAVLLTSVVILLRVPMLGTNAGLSAATIPLGLGGLALLLDMSRLKSA